MINIPCIVRQALKECHSKDKTIAWGAFGIVWEWAIKQEWWKKICRNMMFDSSVRLYDYINPDRFADAVYEFLRAKDT